MGINSDKKNLDQNSPFLPLFTVDAVSKFRVGQSGVKKVKREKEVGKVLGLGERRGEKPEERSNSTSSIIITGITRVQ